MYHSAKTLLKNQFKIASFLPEKEQNSAKCTVKFAIMSSNWNFSINHHLWVIHTRTAEVLAARAVFCHVVHIYHKLLHEYLPIFTGWWQGISLIRNWFWCMLNALLVTMNTSPCSRGAAAHRSWIDTPQRHSAWTQLPGKWMFPSSVSSIYQKHSKVTQTAVINIEIQATRRFCTKAFCKYMWWRMTDHYPIPCKPMCKSWV